MSVKKSVRVRGALCALALAVVSTVSSAGPSFDQSRQELESVLADLIAWLPGGWDSYQIGRAHV